MIRFLLTALILFVAMVWMAAHDHHQRKAVEAELREVAKLARIEIICAAKHPLAGFEECVDQLMAGWLRDSE